MLSVGNFLYHQISFPRYVKCDYIGMIKVGKEGKTKYHFECKDLTAPAIIRKLNKRGEKKYSRKLKCWYISADFVFAGTHLRLFFIRRSKRGPWCGLLTTDLDLGFFEAYKIYSRRCSQEVIFKESKRTAGTGQMPVCQLRGAEALVNESDELAHICELYQCKMAS